MNGKDEEYSGLARYIEAEHGDLEGWLRDVMVWLPSCIPGLAGVAIRSVWDRPWIRGNGRFALEAGVRILGAKYIRIDGGVYIDAGAYLHGREGGLSIGKGSRLMRGAVVHVYNFRKLESAGVNIGQDCVIGINCVITGQGGVEIEDKVIMAPGSMVLPVDHAYSDREVPIKDQGIVGKGIRVKSGAWIGAGAIVLDGVTVGRNAVVGAGAVVTEDVADGAVVTGVPAREIKRI